MSSNNGRLRLWPISGWRIGFKLPLFFLALTLVPLVLITTFVMTYSRNILLNQGNMQLQAAGRSTAQQIDQELEDQREYITMMGQMPEIVRYAQNQNDASARDSALKALKAAANRSADYESVGILDNQGKVILSSAATDTGSDFRFRPYFVEALKGESHISDPSIAILTNQPVIFYSAPVKNDSGTVIGVVRSRLNLDAIWSLVERDANITGPGSFGMLFDENGLRLADSNSKGNRQWVQDNLLFRAIAPLPPQVERALISENRFGKRSAEGVQIVPLPEIAAHLASQDTNVFTTRSDVNSTLNQATIIGLRNKPWLYVVSAPQATFTAPADAVSVFAIISAVVLGIIAVVLAIVLSRSITRPLAQLAQVADRISLGEMDAKITVASNDEVGELAEALIRMQASLSAALERWRARRVNV